MDWLGFITVPVTSGVNYLANRFAKKARLGLSLPERAVKSCVLSGNGWDEGFVPVVSEHSDLYPAKDYSALGCVCLTGRNAGWGQDAVNTSMTAYIHGASGAIPITTYWAHKPSNAEVLTIPHRGARNLVLGLIDGEAEEFVACSWAYPKARTPSAPSWQLRIPLGEVMHFSFELTSDSARTLYGTAYIEISKAQPYTVKIVSWSTTRRIP